MVNHYSLLPKSMEQKQVNLRDAQQVLMISIAEGNGTDKFPYQIINYIVTKDGSILGKVDRNWMKLLPETH